MSKLTFDEYEATRNTFIIPSDMPIPRLMKYELDRAKVTCPALMSDQVIRDFAERETGRGGWMVAIGYPIQEEDGTWTWELLQ
jgi:hypothetical protein